MLPISQYPKSPPTIILVQNNVTRPISAIERNRNLFTIVVTAASSAYPTSKQRIKEELEKINGKKKLRRRLGALNLDLSVLKLDEKIRCANGSISKKLVCGKWCLLLLSTRDNLHQNGFLSVHCPRGTYHNYTTNSCLGCPIGSYNDQTGQTSCQPCPEHHSTRKLNAKHAHECKPQCPPGTVARLKLLKKTKPNGGNVNGAVKYHKTLMPFCRLCEPGQYQEQYNRAQCLACPSNHSSPRGSKSAADCFPIGGQLCLLIKIPTYRLH